MNKRALGADKERAALEYMEECGFRAAERNYRTRTGEIDIIGYDGEYLVFAEVKYRSSGSKGTSLEAVDIRKQRQICKTADHYRATHKVDINQSIRYDVVGMDGDDIRWIKNAFGHIAVYEKPYYYGR